MICFTASLGDILKDMHYQISQFTNIFSSLITPVESSIIGNFANKIPVKLPLSSPQDVETFEHFLSQQSNFNLCVVYFGSYGGKDIKAIVSHIMKNLMTDGLAATYNMKGRNSKYAFEGCRNILNLIFCSSIRNPHQESITILEVKKYVQDWLKYGKIRYDRSVEKIVKNVQSEAVKFI